MTQCTVGLQGVGDIILVDDGDDNDDDEQKCDNSSSCTTTRSWTFPICPGDMYILR